MAIIKARQGKDSKKNKLAQMMGMQAKAIDPYVKEKGEGHGVSGDLLLTFKQLHSNDEAGMDMMALAIYGLVIFPKALGYVDDRVINLFSQFKHGVNPIPVILSETFRSLNHFRTEEEGRFVGCAPLLDIWMESHLKCIKDRFTRPYLPENRIPIKEKKDLCPSSSSSFCSSPSVSVGQALSSTISAPILRAGEHEACLLNCSFD